MGHGDTDPPAAKFICSCCGWELCAVHFAGGGHDLREIAPPGVPCELSHCDAHWEICKEESAKR